MSTSGINKREITPKTFRKGTILERPDKIAKVLGAAFRKKDFRGYQCLITEVREDKSSFDYQCVLSIKDLEVPPERGGWKLRASEPELVTVELDGGLSVDVEVEPVDKSVDTIRAIEPDDVEDFKEYASLNGVIQSLNEQLTEARNFAAIWKASAKRNHTGFKNSLKSYMDVCEAIPAFGSSDVVADAVKQLRQQNTMLSANLATALAQISMLNLNGKPSAPTAKHETCIVRDIQDKAFAQMLDDGWTVFHMEFTPAIDSYQDRLNVIFIRDCDSIIAVTSDQAVGTAQ